MSDQFVLTYDADSLLDAIESLGPPNTLEEGRVSTAAVVLSAIISEQGSRWEVGLMAGRITITRVPDGGVSGEAPPPSGAELERERRAQANLYEGGAW